MADTKPRQRKFAPRSRLGCLSCRARRKRCDLTRPQCDTCTRLNLECVWQPQRKLREAQSSKHRPTTSELQVSHPPHSLDFWDLLPLGRDEASEQKQLLDYYLAAYVPSVSVTRSATSYYTSLYMPWAFQFDGMLSALLAISSAQLARRIADPDRANQLKTISARHEKRCYAFIKERVSPSGQPLRDTYQVIAAILILVGLSALNGVTSTRWIDMLRCARKLLNDIPAERSILDCVEVDSLHRHFTYHYAWTSLMARVDGASSSTSLTSQDISSSITPLLPAMTTIDPLMGISYQLCDLIGQIQYVTSVSPAFPHITEASFLAIETGIKSWAYDSPFSLGIELTLALDLIALAEAYRLAALIQLYRTSPTHRPQIPEFATSTMDFVARIPPGSPAESSLLYPMLLAGAELNDEKATERCSKRLEEIQGRNRYENVGMVQKVLQEVWRSSKETGQRRDWEDVLRAWKWSFTVG